MAIEDNYTIPLSASELPIRNDQIDKLFICFIASTDPATQQPWCSDVRAALPRLEKIFSSPDAPRLSYVHVGLKPEYVLAFHKSGNRPQIRSLLTSIARWRDPNNKYRKEWGINAVPTLICYQRNNGKVEATGQLVEGELVDNAKLLSFAAQ